MVHDVMAGVANFASGIDQVLSRLSQKNRHKSSKLFHAPYEHSMQNPLLTSAVSLRL